MSPIEGTDAETKPMRLLLVDDEPDVRSLYRVVLEEGGFQVVDFATAHEAAQEARRTSYDIAVIDERMARVRGLALARWLRRRFPGMVILVASAYADWDMYFRASACGATDVVSKTLPARELLRVARMSTGRTPSAESGPQ